MDSMTRWIGCSLLSGAFTVLLICVWCIVKGGSKTTVIEREVDNERSN